MLGKHEPHGFAGSNPVTSASAYYKKSRNAGRILPPSEPGITKDKLFTKRLVNHRRGVSL